MILAENFWSALCNEMCSSQCSSTIIELTTNDWFEFMSVLYLPRVFCHLLFLYLAPYGHFLMKTFHICLCRSCCFNGRIRDRESMTNTFHSSTKSSVIIVLILLFQDDEIITSLCQDENVILYC